MIYIETPQELKRALELRIEGLQSQILITKSAKAQQMLHSEIRGIRMAIEYVDDHIATLAKRVQP